MSESIKPARFTTRCPQMERSPSNSRWTTRRTRWWHWTVSSKKTACRIWNSANSAFLPANRAHTGATADDSVTDEDEEAEAEIDVGKTGEVEPHGTTGASGTAPRLTGRHPSMMLRTMNDFGSNSDAHATLS